MKNHGRRGTVWSVRKMTPELAKPSKETARLLMKLKMSSAQRQFCLYATKFVSRTASLSSQNEERNHELQQHAHDHRMPLDCGSIPRSSPEPGKEDSKTK